MARKTKAEQRAFFRYLEARKIIEEVFDFAYWHRIEQEAEAALAEEWRAGLVRRRDPQPDEKP